MKRIVASLAAFGAVLLLAVPAQASGAGAVSITQTFHDETQSFPSVEPCTGVTGTLTITFNGVAHVTFLTSGIGAGTGWATFTATGTFVFAGSNGITETGKFTIWDGENLNLNNFATTAILVAHGTASDGSTFKFHAVMHISVSASGIQMSFDKLTCG